MIAPLSLIQPLRRLRKAATPIPIRPGSKAGVGISFGGTSGAGVKLGSKVGVGISFGGTTGAGALRLLSLNQLVAGFA